MTESVEHRELVNRFREVIRDIPGWPAEHSDAHQHRLVLWDRLHEALAAELGMESAWDETTGYPVSMTSDSVVLAGVLGVRPVMLIENVATTSITLTHTTVYDAHVCLHFFARSRGSGPFRFTQVDVVTTENDLVPSRVWDSAAYLDDAGATHQFSVMIETSSLSTAGIRIILSGTVLTTRLDSIVESTDRRVVFYVPSEFLR